MNSILEGPKSAGRAFALLAVAWTLTTAPLAGQQATAQAAMYTGTVGASLALRQLEGVKRVLVIGAHPDDEDTSLLAALARGQGVETAYLALTRGDGGQNLIGPELGEGLGAVRTGELLAARRLDGGRQFFTRAFDFGFSKTAEEALRLWPEEELLRDVTWVVRTFRPQVVVSIFSGTPADGHGQHQAAGIMAQEVFRAAGDPERFPEQLQRGIRPWQPAKLYRRPRGDPDSTVIRVETGDYDPLLGRSHHQLAMESRSQHRSQDMGVAQPLGPRSSSLVLVDRASGVEAGPGEGLFAGVDTTMAGLFGSLPGRVGEEAARWVQAYREAVHDAMDQLDALHPERAVEPLGRVVAALDALDGIGRATGDRNPEVGSVLTGKRRLAREALAAATGAVVDVRVEDDLVVPGETVTVSVDLWGGGPLGLSMAKPTLSVPAGWGVEAVVPEPPAEGGAGGRGGGGGFGGRGGGGPDLANPSRPTDLSPGEAVRWQFRVEVPTDADVSRLYYLEEGRVGEMYRWPDRPEVWGLPRDPAPVVAEVSWTLPSPGDASDIPVSLERAGVFVGVDPAWGEYREPMLVVPALSVRAEPTVLVWPEGTPGPRPVTVALRAFGSEGLSGAVRLEVPPGWSATPESVPFSFEGSGQDRQVAFSVEAGDSVEAGRHPLRAVATTADGRTFDESVDLIDYPHIDRVALYEPAEVAATVVPVTVREGLRVGYVMGSGDEVAEAIRRLGVDVELLGPEQVSGGDLSVYDVLVLGIRTYETRPDLRAANDRILDFARNGGTVVVQYNQYQYPAGDFAPYPVDISRPHDRTTDETSPVGFLEPDAPVFTTPNRITPEDFEGWVTERGLYFLGEWDERFVPVLELVDPGEEPKHGALLVAPLGEGLYVYTGLSFFRELPAGVPGAYRLFANLLSLTAADWNAWRERAP